uniref:Cation efflux protein transmembrane domain-containing protein n=1 Tax=Fagus sylvatica TaxID=28930 RepID=A0A2N9HHU2_FAGSY
MENSDPKTPLLEASRSGRRGGKLSRRYSVNSLRTDFITKLPDKVRSGLDPESPLDLDLSRVSGLTKVDALMAPNSDEDEHRNAEEAYQERLMQISNYANVVLLALKIYATIKSGSLAIAASTLDSLLDLMAGGILWFTHLSMKNINIYKYPIGKLRVQPVGIIIFAAIMATLGFQVLLQAVEQLAEDSPTEDLTSSQLIWMCAIMISATVDHFFDVVTNVVGLAAALLADKFYWWIDPTGAILLALYTITNWSKVVMENAASLVGQSASPEVLQKLTYLVMRHPQVDIELPEDLPLKEAHMIGETLQEKLEKLPEVERAFVHLDFECDHKPEHSVLSRLPAS